MRLTPEESEEGGSTWLLQSDYKHQSTDERGNIALEVTSHLDNEGKVPSENPHAPFMKLKTKWKNTEENATVRAPQNQGRRTIPPLVETTNSENEFNRTVQYYSYNQQTICYGSPGFDLDSDSARVRLCIGFSNKGVVAYMERFFVKSLQEQNLEVFQGKRFATLLTVALLPNESWSTARISDIYIDGDHVPDASNGDLTTNPFSFEKGYPVSSSCDEDKNAILSPTTNWPGIFNKDAVELGCFRILKNLASRKELVSVSEETIAN